LANPEVHTVALFQVMADKLSIPHILGIAKRPGRMAKVPSVHLQGRRLAWTIPFAKPGKPTLYKALHPILCWPTPLPKRLGHLTAGRSGKDQQHAVQSLIMSGLIGPEGFLLQGDSHNACILDFQFSHIGLLPRENMPERYGIRTAGYGKGEPHDRCLEKRTSSA
jgi:hypothetical protein